MIPAVRVLVGAVAAAGLGLVAVVVGAIAAVAWLPDDLHDVFGPDDPEAL